MAGPELQYAGNAFLQPEYPNQYKRMVGYAQSKGIANDTARDLANDAWLKALETFDESKGLDRIQWAWWIFQHNVLPGYGRERKKNQLAEKDSEFNDEAAPESEKEDADPLFAFLRNHLPDDLRSLLDLLLSILEKTDSKHINQEAAQRLNISIKECRNRMKRLRRACHNLKPKWEQRR
jgi:DNA-directed RNA polymerase specialized sigma24 family protein